MGAESFKWEFFIAHAGADIESAEELYGYLNSAASVFLDKACLLLGDDWDRKLAAAQRASLVTLVLVSSQTDQAYYQREEIAAAIDLARRNENNHRVIPIYLDGATEPPYGLRLKHALRLGAELSMSDAAAQLLAELPRIKALAGDAHDVPVVPSPAPVLGGKVALSLAVDPTVASGEAEDEALALAYEYGQDDKNTIVISPQLGYLESIACGGPIAPTRFDWVPFSWDFPKLDFKVINNSKETILLSDIVFEVEESKLDPTPVLIVKPDIYQSNALHFRLINEGWGPAVGLKACFNLTPTDARNSAKPTYGEPYPYEVQVGDVDEDANVDISSELVKAGVDLRGLADLGVMTQRDGDVSTFVNEKGVERTFDEAQLWAARQQLFGRFTSGGALVSGELRYTARTVDGAAEERRVKFWTVVWLFNENRKGKPRPPSYEYATKFKVEGINYKRQLSISQEVKAGDTDRFLVKVGFDKSSRHRFRARLLYNGGREVVSANVLLYGFAPRSGISHLRDENSKKR
ncbi:MAG TPA: toll/interleukin-1 receptor domain-containing protein [Polyangiaceae bacterium]|nr:toll/interleukin-1 receptor domain-containing protein [Polyangiaceae bacterium]